MSCIEFGWFVSDLVWLELVGLYCNELNCIVLDLAWLDYA